MEGLKVYSEKIKYAEKPPYTNRDIHTSPKLAGRKNMENALFPKDKEGLIVKMIPVMEHGIQEECRYHGQWTDNEFQLSVNEFFQYCLEVQLKPVRPALQLWLRVSKAQYSDWLNKPDTFPTKSAIVNFAEQMFELYLQLNIDKNPAGSIFLLKTLHGHVETSRLDVVNNTNEVLPEQIEERILKLGLEQTN